MVVCNFLWYKFIGTGWCMIDALVYGAYRLQVEVHLDAWLIHGSGLLVHLYSHIYHIDSVIVVSSFYFNFRVVG
jgi:hypothetical protein